MTMGSNRTAQLSVTEADGIAIVALSRPPSVDSAGKHALTEQVEAIAGRTDIRVVILTASHPSAFLVDVAELAHMEPAAAADFLHPQNEGTAEDLEEVKRASAQPGALTASFQLYRSIPEDIEDFASAYAAKIATPVLALGGEHCFAARVIETFREVAHDVTGGVLEATAHFPPLERSAATAERVRSFLEEHPLAERTSNNPTSPGDANPC